MPRNYRPGLDVVRLAALLPVLCYHYCIEAARLGFAVPTALIGRGMADWVEIGLAWFFLLSGAALCLQWQGRFSARRYFMGRVAATYPAFWLGFAALFVYGEVLHGNNADIPRLAVLLVLAAVLFWAVYAAGQRLPRRFCPALRRLAGWCYGVYLVHHVLLTLVFLRAAARFDLPLTGMFPVYLVVSFALAAVLMAVSGPISKAIKKLA